MIAQRLTAQLLSGASKVVIPALTSTGPNLTPAAPRSANATITPMPSAAANGNCGCAIGSRAWR